MWVHKLTNQQLQAQRLIINMMHAIIILRKINHRRKTILMPEQTRRLFISSTLISYFLTCKYINAQFHHSNSLLTCDHWFTQFTAIPSISAALHWLASTRCWPQLHTPPRNCNIKTPNKGHNPKTRVCQNY